MIPTGASTIGTAWFLDGLANLQQRQTQTQKQLSTGFQVTTAADSPSQTSELVALEATLSSVQSYQTNLGSVQAEAQLADTALGNATSLIDSARSLAAEGANTVTTAAQRQSLATQIQGIQEQLVTIANSASAGRYIFGGDQDQTAPYRFNAASAAGADSLSAATATRVIVNPIGQAIFQSLSATSIFNPTDPAGVPLSGNTFVALQSLRTALLANDLTGVTAAIDLLKSSSDYLIRQQSSYGASEQRINREQNDAANQVTALRVRIGNIRDADTVKAATDLTLENTSQQAALGAQAAIPRKSLFDYIG